LIRPAGVVDSDDGGNQFESDVVAVVVLVDVVEVVGGSTLPRGRQEEGLHDPRGYFRVCAGNPVGPPALHPVVRILPVCVRIFKFGAKTSPNLDCGEVAVHVLCELPYLELLQGVRSVDHGRHLQQGWRALGQLLDLAATRGDAVVVDLVHVDHDGLPAGWVGRGCAEDGRLGG